MSDADASMMSYKPIRRDLWGLLCPHDILEWTISSIGMASEDVVVNGRDCGVQEAFQSATREIVGWRHQPPLSSSSADRRGSSRPSSVSKQPNDLQYHLASLRTYYLGNVLRDYLQ